MNIDFEVKERPGFIALRMHTMKDVLASEVRDMIHESVRRGAATARRLAPRGPILERNDGRTIRDSVQEEYDPFAPGGRGGGGAYEARFYASGNIAPHLRYVLEGTKDVEPITSTTKGNVMAMQKGGEKPVFRYEVSGQEANPYWWEAAREEAEIYLNQRIASLYLPQD